MECRDVRELADSFVAEELLTETNHEMQRHLDSCPACRAEIDGRRRVRDALRTAIGRADRLAPRPEFVAALQRQLRTASGVRARRSTVLRRWLALAATVLLAVSAGVLYRFRGGADDLARSAVGDHRNCALHFRLAERPISLDEAAQRYGAMYRIVQQLPPAVVTTNAGTARVLERHACVYAGRRFAHIVLEYRHTRVSVMVTTADRSGGGGRLPPRSVDGMPLVSVTAGRQIVFIAGEVSADEMTALANAINEPLTRALAEI